KNRFEGGPSFLPIADVVTIVFAEVTQRGWIRRVHQVRLSVQLVGCDIAPVHFSYQAAPYRSFDQRTLSRLKHRRRRDACNLSDAELLQFLGCIFRLLWEKTFLIEDGLINLDCAILVAGLYFPQGFIHLFGDAALTLLHFT